MSEDLFHELQFLRLVARANIYGMTLLQGESTSTVAGNSSGADIGHGDDTAGHGQGHGHSHRHGVGLLVSHQVSDESTESKVFHIALNGPHCNSATVPLNYIPAEADIVSMDSFQRKSRDSQSSSSILAVALAKPSAASKSFVYFLNIYGAASTGPLDLQQLSGDCQSIAISYVPFLITHASITGKDGHEETFFLVCGGDNHVHLFKEDPSTKLFQEHPIGHFFPELERVQNKVLSLSIATAGTRRYVAVGCQDGTVQLGIGPLEFSEADLKEEDIHIHRLSFDGPVTSVSLFTTSVTARENSFNRSAHKPLHLLVCGSLDYACVYDSVETKGLGTPVLLPQSDMHDSILCSHVADIDFDGKNELILGTYGQALLVYRGDPASGYELSWKRLFSFPLCSLLTSDLTGDGLQELVVLSLFGVHVMQPNLHAAREKIAAWLKKQKKP